MPLFLEASFSKLLLNVVEPNIDYKSNTHELTSIFYATNSREISKRFYRSGSDIADNFC